MKPISPQQLFNRLMSSNYKQIQCQDTSSKHKKQRQILLELIVQYQDKIQCQLIRLNQQESLQKLQRQRQHELEVLNRQRQIVENQVQKEFERLTVKKEEKSQKYLIINQLQSVRFTNSKLKLKLKDLNQYVLKLQLHNRNLQSQREISQSKAINRMRVNSEDWRNNIKLVRKEQQIHENDLRAKILQKETENIDYVRKEQEEISRRNQLQWENFRQIVRNRSNSLEPLRPIEIYNRPEFIPPYHPPMGLSRRLPVRNFQRFRVI